MKYKKISSLLALQLLTLPCMGKEQEEVENKKSLPVHIEVEQTEENRNQEDKAKHILFPNDADPIAFTPRALYRAAQGGEQRAIDLLEYLAEMYGHTFPRLDDAEGSFKGKNYDGYYALPLELFTQKTLDERLWVIDEFEFTLNKLFPEPKPIQAGATYEVIQALRSATGAEEQNIYNKRIGRKVLRTIATTAARIIKENAKKIQTHENEKAEVEQILNKTDLMVTEVKNKLQETQEEHLKLTTAHQKQEATLQEALEREKTLITEKTLLEAALTEIQETLSKTQVNFSKLTTEHDETMSALTIANNKLKELEQKNSNYEETIRQVAALINPQPNS